MVEVDVRRRSGDAGACGYCRTPLGDGEPRRTCACGAAYHAACALELGACGALGCRRPLAEADPGGPPESDDPDVERARIAGAARALSSGEGREGGRDLLRRHAGLLVACAAATAVAVGYLAFTAGLRYAGWALPVVAVYAFVFGRRRWRRRRR